MRKIIMILPLCVTTILVFACPVCERNKPKILQGITHGTGPDSNWDYVTVITIGIIALFTLFYSIKWLIKPNENNTDHIKYSFLNKE